MTSIRLPRRRMIEAALAGAAVFGVSAGFVEGVGVATFAVGFGRAFVGMLFCTGGAAFVDGGTGVGVTGAGGGSCTTPTAR